MNIKTSAPKSKQLADMIREQILGGKLKPGEFIESVRETAKRFSVSQQVVRSAFDILRREKLIIQEIGCGTYVNPRLKAGGMRFQIGFYLHNDTLENCFYRALFHGCCKYGSKLGLETFLLWDISGAKSPDGKANLDFMIVTGCVDNALIKTLKRVGIPFVIVGNYSGIPADVNNFSLDVYSMFTQLASVACRELKPESLGIVLGGRMLPSSRLIAKAVEDHIRSAGLETKSPNCLFTDSKYGYEEICDAWLDHPASMPDAVMVTIPSYLAFARAIYERGITPDKRPKIIVWLDGDTMDDMPYDDIAACVFSMGTSGMMFALMKWISGACTGSNDGVLKISYFDQEDIRMLR